jgi:UDP-N-acetylmuramoylalanine--D-glutamate ligase
MLGGRGKGVSYEPLREALVGRARIAVLFGEDRQLIKEAIGDSVPCILVEGLREGTECALSLLSEGEALLLSPAATSYDEFSSFEERGNLFKQIVREHYF